MDSVHALHRDGLFSFDDVLEVTMNPPPVIRALVGRISRDVAERGMMSAWILASRRIHAWERSTLSEHVDLGGES